MNYSLFFENPELHLIRVQMNLPAHHGNQAVHLPRWRPGRYEMARYAERIVDARAWAENGRALEVYKTDTHTWQIAMEGEPAVFEYKYHAIVADAGGSFFDQDQVYVNPCNLLMYDVTRMDAACEMTLYLPEDYRIACGLRHNGNTLLADSYHDLVDAPLIASQTLQHHAFVVQDILFNIWFQGDVKPNWHRIEGDYTAIIKAQLRMFRGFPAEDYHFMYQIHNKRIYHGVEHRNSTVIALGPGYQMDEEEKYEEQLSISSHELFHAWNVKAIRPAEMRPYSYDREQYSRLHYITEGVTTYYGELMVLKAGIWSLDVFLKAFNRDFLQKHFANNGRDHISLEHSSFESWLVGYGDSGVPNRKISFYTKGGLAAFLLDVIIRKGSANDRSLDSVMLEMFERFGRTGVGYTKQDYKTIAETHAGHSLDDYFRDFISGIVPMEKALGEAADYLGLALIPKDADTLAERVYGFIVYDEGGSAKIKQVHEGSPAEAAGLAVGDLIVAIQGHRTLVNDVEPLLRFLTDDEDVQVHVFRNEMLEHIVLESQSDYRFKSYVLVENHEATEVQLHNRSLWSRPGSGND
jgi:predicted metalloprotease with PDZ domain